MISFSKLFGDLLICQSIPLSQAIEQTSFVAQFVVLTFF
uniref:Uncharacterized protein n=1 Tax=Arundo donax TaxID=35708 RepID=A0A0A8ZYB9_ARUDO